MYLDGKKSWIFHSNSFYYSIPSLINCHASFFPIFVSEENKTN
ncbi:conserved hypothetical protein, partial [Listeria monocytogenes FSL F2-208]